MNRTGKCGHRLRVFALLIGLASISVVSAPPVASALEPASGCLNGWQFFDDGNAYACQGGGGNTGLPGTPAPPGERYWDFIDGTWRFHDLTGGAPFALEMPSHWKFVAADRDSNDGHSFNATFSTPYGLNYLGNLRILDAWFRKHFGTEAGIRDPFLGCSLGRGDVPKPGDDVNTDCRASYLSGSQPPPSCEGFKWTVPPGFSTVEFETHCYDPNRNPVSIALIEPPAHGAASTNGSTLSYIPAFGFYGEDTLTYSASNGFADRASRPMNLTLRVNAPPVCSQQGDVWAARGVEKTFTLTCDDPYLSEGFKAEIQQDPAHGKLSTDGAQMTYTADPEYLGPDSFTVSGVDGWGLGAATSTTYHVDVREAPPVCEPTVAYGVGRETEDAVKFKISCGMPNGLKLLSPLTYWVGDGEHGTASVNPLTGQVVYYPDDTSPDIDHVPYGAMNGGMNSNSSVVTVRMKHPDR